MSSATSPVRDTLDAYLAGRARAEHVVAVVAEAYYREGGRGTRDGLKPLLDVIERAAPGVVELTRGEGGQGFAIRAGVRPFPPEEEPALRAAAAVVVGAWGGKEQEDVPASRGVLAGLMRALQRLFR